MRQGCRQFKIGESTGFICGGEPIDHKCNEDAIVYDLKSGERIFFKNGMGNNWYEENYEQVIGASVACSICGRAAVDNANYL